MDLVFFFFLSLLYGHGCVRSKKAKNLMRVVFTSNFGGGGDLFFLNPFAGIYLLLLFRSV